MIVKGKPIRLSEYEDRLLRTIYVQFEIPRDQYKKRPEDMALFERTWRNLSGRDDNMAELVRYMQNQQKAKRRLPVPWPVFNGSHKRAPTIASMLDENGMMALKSAYEATVLPLEVGTDAAAWHDDAVEALAKEFARLAGRIVPGLLLLAIAEEKRKRGLWFLVGRSGTSEDFGDLDKIDHKE